MICTSFWNIYIMHNTCVPLPLNIVCIVTAVVTPVYYILYIYIYMYLKTFHRSQLAKLNIQPQNSMFPGSSPRVPLVFCPPRCPPDHDKKPVACLPFDFRVQKHIGSAIIIICTTPQARFGDGFIAIRGLAATTTPKTQVPLSFVIAVVVDGGWWCCCC